MNIIRGMGRGNKGGGRGSKCPTGWNRNMSEKRMEADGLQGGTVTRICSMCRRLSPPGSYICGDSRMTCFDCLNVHGESCCRFEAFKKVCGKRLSLEPTCPTAFEMNIVRKKRSPTLQLQQGSSSNIDNLQCWMPECSTGKSFSSHLLIRHLMEVHHVESYSHSRCRGMITWPWEEWRLHGAGDTHVLFVLENENGIPCICVATKQLVDEVPLIFIILLHGDNPGKMPLFGTVELFDNNGFGRSWSGRLPSVRTALEHVSRSCSGLIIPRSLTRSVTYVRTVIHANKKEDAVISKGEQAMKRQL